MSRRYHILDVFTATKLAGNPLAVVIGSDALDDSAMRAIAREFNLSETVFVSPPRDPVNSAAVRIFTPTTELPFAGHPTIGAAILIAKLRAPDLLAREDVGVVLEAPIGAISCSVRHRRGEAAHASFEVPRLAEMWGEAPDAPTAAARLRLAIEDVGFGRHRPTCFSAGNPFTFVPLTSVEALGRARLGPDWGEQAMVYLYARAPGADPLTFRSRMLSIGYGVPEDPATGSAAAAFAGVLAANEMLADGDHDCFLLQGVEMGRPSRIGVAFTMADGRLTAAAIGGSAVMVAEGVLAV